MPPRPIPHSKSQINKAGRTLRRWGRGELIAPDTIDRALRILEDFRAAHSISLTTATMGLRSMVKSEGCRQQVTQRLKRRETILAKLMREPTLPLASMQDIAGCRAVVDSIAEVRRIRARLQRNRPVYATYDYINSPRSSGYRGVHVVVDYHSRQIEVQLRTIVMHEWAIAVERLGRRIDEDLKSGDGPAEVLAWLRAVSRAMAMEEAGKAVPADLTCEIDTLRAGAVPFLRGAPA